MIKWVEGRQGTGVLKALILSSAFLFRFDLWLLKFPVGSKLNPHVDPYEGGRHFRVNLILKEADGGEFITSDDTILNTRFLKIFRPDLCTHEVTEVYEGTRYVLSLGWVLNEKEEL